MACRNAEEEPATIAVATARTDRKKMDLENFEIRRFYFQNADVPGEIVRKRQSLVPTNIILRREPFVTVCA